MVCGVLLLRSWCGCDDEAQVVRSKGINDCGLGKAKVFYICSKLLRGGLPSYIPFLFVSSWFYFYGERVRHLTRV